MSAYNGSGAFVISGTGLPYVTNTTISSTVGNQLNTDLATGLSTAICKDGQTTVTNNIPMAGFKLTGVGAATTSGDALSYGRAANVTQITATANGIGTNAAVVVSSTGVNAALTFDTPSTGIADARRWTMQGGSGSFGLSTLSDSNGSQKTVLSISRSGANPTSWTFRGTTWDWGDVTDNNYAFSVDGSATSTATGLRITTAAAGAGLAVAVQSSGTNEALTIDAKGSGTITLGGTSTGAIALTRATTLSAALTYGGVALSNSVAGTGSMALQAEGSWTPAISFGGAAVGVTYSTQTGFYKRIGNLVWVSWNLALSAKGSSTGAALIGGLPFTSNAASFGTGNLWLSSGMSGLTGATGVQVNRNGTAMSLIQTGSTGTAALDNTNFTNSSQLVGSAIFSVGTES